MFKTLLSIVLFVVAGGLLFGYATRTYSLVQNTLAETAQYTQANGQVKKVQELRNTLAAKYQQLSPQNIARLQSLLPDHVDNVKLVLDIDGIAERRGIRIGNVVARTETGKDGASANTQQSLAIDEAALDAQKYKSLILDFNVVASYSDFVLFMRDLEQSLRIVDLVSLKMDPAASHETTQRVPTEIKTIAGGADVADAPLEYQYTVSIKTYWLP